MATITVGIPELRKAAAWATPGKTPVPALGHVRVSVAGGQLVLAVYDWETCHLARFPGPGDGQTGTMLAPARDLAAAVKLLPKSGQVEVRVDGDRVDLVQGGKRVGVEQTCDPATYPALPAPPPPSGWCDAAQLGPALRQAARCCADEGTLPLIRAVHFVLGGMLGLEATDRFILGVDEVPFHAAGNPAGSFLVPGREAGLFAAGCSAGPVFIAAPPAAGQDAMLGDSWHTLVVRTVTGEYPRVRTIIRKPAVKATFTADADTLAKACQEAGELLGEAQKTRLAAVLADTADDRKESEKKNHVAEDDGAGMFLDAAPAGVEMYAVNPVTGAELGRWPVAAGADGEAVVSLRPWFLDRLIPAGAGQVTVKLAGKHDPVTVSPAGSRYQGTIAPVKGDPPAKPDPAGDEEEGQA